MTTAVKYMAKTTFMTSKVHEKEEQRIKSYKFQHVKE